ncbi:MAG: DUF2079 domain-containing protein [Actinomycetota bacterium]
MNCFKQLKINPIIWITAGASAILFLCSSARHILFKSNAFDLGIFDQFIYLISQGQPPFSSFVAVHALGDHGAWILYLLALFYKISPSIYWLLLVQAISLALGAWPTWSLARQAGLTPPLSLAMATVYLLYPLVFNINLFDFHPEVMAVPALLGAILAARLNRLSWFCLALIWIMACKGALALTIAAMGVWLLLFEKKRLYGAIALTAGVAYFIIVTWKIIPAFDGGTGPLAVRRYAYLGNSILEVILNLILKPWLVLQPVFSFKTLEYLGLLCLPVIWGLAPKYLSPLIGALPTLMMNILSELDSQRDLVHQYSLPILPFLIVAAIASLAAREKNRDGIEEHFKGTDRPDQTEKVSIKPEGTSHHFGSLIPQLITNFEFPIASPLFPKFIILWSLISFLILGKYGYFWTIYADALDTWQATREAVSFVQTKGNVLTTADIASHLTHRPIVKLTKNYEPPSDLTSFSYVLLNLRHPGWNSDREFVTRLINQLKNHPQFQLKYQRDEVFLFTKTSK